MNDTNAEIADRRVLRTRRALRDAFLSLMEERGWDAVNVQDICERADVGRSTFYLHFQSKDELLAGGFADLAALLRSQAAGSKGPLAFLPGLIDHVGEQKKLFRSLIGHRGGLSVQMRFRAMVLALIEDDLSRHLAKGWQRQATAHYLAGALVECLIWWVESRPARKAEELESHFRKLSEAALSASL